MRGTKAWTLPVPEREGGKERGRERWRDGERDEWITGVSLCHISEGELGVLSLLRVYMYKKHSQTFVQGRY